MNCLVDTIERKINILSYQTPVQYYNQPPRFVLQVLSLNHYEFLLRVLVKREVTVVQRSVLFASRESTDEEVAISSASRKQCSPGGLTEIAAG